MTLIIIATTLRYLSLLSTNRKLTGKQSEADFMGLLIMAQSCYDPSSAVGVWQRMQQAEEFSRPQFLSTHPTSKNRETQIQEWLPQAMDKFNASECGSTSYWGNQFRSQFPSESESFW